MENNFDYFVILGMMRCGSNALAQRLNAIDGLHCYGEIFNAALPDKDEIEIEASAPPQSLLQALKSKGTKTRTLHGFRLFPEHDETILQEVLSDPRCAKILMTRNPVDQYLSLQKAMLTNQWQVTDSQQQQDVKLDIHGPDLRDYIRTSSQSWKKTLHRLQENGQAGFFLDYADLSTPSSMSGLIQFLGVDRSQPRQNQKFKPQTPKTAIEKVKDPQKLRAAVETLGAFALETPTGRSYLSSTDLPELWRNERDDIVIMNVGRFGPAARSIFLNTINNTHLALPKGSTGALIAHPLIYAHNAFVGTILAQDPIYYRNIKARLVKNHGLDLPDDPKGNGYSLEHHRYNFQRFLEFLGRNLMGQTAIPIKTEWAPQSETLRQVSDQYIPKVIVEWHELVVSQKSTTRDIKNDPHHFDRYDFRYLVSDVMDFDAQALEVYHMDDKKLRFARLK